MKQKIYHLHIRKTGGRSVHSAVFERTGHDATEIYQFLSKHPGCIAEVGDFKIGAWVSDLSRDFDYSFSHNPFYQVLNITDDVFMLCCFRDPVQRLLSLWKMLKTYITNRANRAKPHPALEEEMAYFDEDYVRFFEKLPDIHRLNQLYMFSETGNLSEATTRLGRMNLILETEDLGAGIKRFFQTQGWSLVQAPHFGASKIPAEISSAAEAALRQLLAAEYALIDKARTMKAHYAYA